MHLYTKIYEFAASAGALEGYVYRRKELDMEALPKWVDNLLSAYKNLPSEALDPFQPSLDQTIGRAIRSLTSTLGEEHGTVIRLKSMVVGSLPDSPDDFQKKKWFEK
ncbi:MAG: hypothetical protein PVH82_12820 [Desulfobacteraceae bacterium]|jgi:hypothetical protein